MECGNEKYGQIVLKGVEMENGGQYDSSKIPTLHMKYLFGGTART